MLVLERDEIEALRDLAVHLKSVGLTTESVRLSEILERGQTPTEIRAPEAAAILHTSPEVVRAWVRRGILPGRVDGLGEAFVDPAPLIRVKQLDAAMPFADPHAPELTDDDVEAEVAAHRAETATE